MVGERKRHPEALLRGQVLSTAAAYVQSKPVTLRVMGFFLSLTLRQLSLLARCITRSVTFTEKYAYFFLACGVVLLLW